MTHATLEETTEVLGRGGGAAGRPVGRALDREASDSRGWATRNVSVSEPIDDPDLRHGSWGTVVDDR